jgi:hypothetical protein
MYIMQNVSALAKSHHRALQIIFVLPEDGFL